MSLMPRHIVLDDFLPAGLHDALLEHALGQQEMFAPGTVRNSGSEAVGDARQNQVCKASLGDLKPELCEAIGNALPAIFEGLGMPAFEPESIELELSVHRDGDFYRPHVDTFVSENREGVESDRVVTAVYYFHAQPRGFSGGEFAIHPLAGGGEPVTIEPRDNRLLAIPAFAVHEVRPIRCESNDFRAARFAVNAWVHRARVPAG